MSLIKEREKNFFTEFLLTFLMLQVVAFLLNEGMAGYGTYLAFGLFFGFGVSWLSRGHHIPAIKIFIAAGILGYGLWSLRLVMASTFLYKDIMLIAVRAGLVFVIILSFDCYRASALVFIRVCSLALFFCFPVFISGKNQIYIGLSLFYFVLWLAIVKNQYFSLAKARVEKKGAPVFALFVTGVSFLVIVAVALTLFTKLRFERIEALNLLLDEVGGMRQDKDSLLEGEYYDLQDKIVTGLTAQFEEKDVEQKIFFLLNQLVNDSSDTMEVDKAEMGLTDFLKRPGPGLEQKDADNMATMIKDYVGKKIIMNLKTNKADLMNIFNKDIFGIKDKMGILERVNKIQYANPDTSLNALEKEALDITQGSRVDPEIKKIVKDRIWRMKELKDLEAYRKKRNMLDRKIDSLPEPLRSDLKNWSAAADAAENLAEFKKAEKALEDLKEKLPGFKKSDAELAREVLSAKLDVLQSGEFSKLKDKVEAFRENEPRTQIKADDTDAVRDALTAKDYSQGVQELRKKVTEKEAALLPDIHDALEIKSDAMVRRIKDHARAILKEKASSDAGKELLGEIDKCASAKDAESLYGSIQKLEERIGKYADQGLILKEDAQVLRKDAATLREVILSGIDFKENKKREEPTQEKKPDQGIGFQDELKKLIEQSSLDEEAKSLLLEYAQKLYKAADLADIEAVQEAVRKQGDALVKNGAIESEVKRIVDKFMEVAEILKMLSREKDLVGLRAKIEELSQTNPEQAEQLKKDLDKVRESATPEKFKKAAAALKQRLENIDKDAENKPESDETKSQSSWQVSVLPSRLLLSAGESANLKPIGTYSGLFIRDLQPEAQWTSSDPAVVEVDARGTVRAIAKGQAWITCVYAGSQGLPSEVDVVDSIPDETLWAVENKASK